MKNAEWIHRPMDGRGARSVFLNGKKIEKVVFADEKKGVVRVLRQPIKIHKHRKRVIIKTLHGEVEVKCVH